MTRGGAATPEPIDLSEISRSGDLLDALAARRLSDPATGAPDDPAARLLAALVADVDAGAPPLPPPARVSRPASNPGRSVVRAFVTFGVATLMLTTAGAAVAGGGAGDGRGKAAGPSVTRLDASERSKSDADIRAAPAGRRAAPDLGDLPPAAPPARGARGPREHAPVRPSAGVPREAPGTGSPSPLGDHGGGGAGRTPHPPISTPPVASPPTPPPTQPPATDPSDDGPTPPAASAPRERSLTRGPRSRRRTSTRRHEAVHSAARGAVRGRQPAS